MDREVVEILTEINKNIEKIYRKQGKIEKELQKHSNLLELIEDYSESLKSIEDNSDKALEIQYSLERYTGDIESKIGKK